MVFASHRQNQLITVTGAVIGLAMVLLLGAPAGAQGNQPLELGDLQIPAPSGYVNDFAGVLTFDEARQLEQMCRQIDRSTGVQIALAIVPTLEEEEATDVRTRLFEAWRVGRARDDRGLLILHALLERRIEVETGYGLEGILPDGLVGRILDESVTPRFREGDFFGGYRGGLEAFAAILSADPESRPGQDAYRSTGRSDRPGGQRRFPLGSLIMIPIFIYLAIRHPRLLLLLLIFGGRGGGRGTGGGFGGGFGGFGGGMSGGGGAGRSY